MGALTKHHGGLPQPMSRVLIFEEGSLEVRCRVYLHKPSGDGHPVGWYEAGAVFVALRHPFQAPGVSR
jgi:hypothetical protein